MIAWAVETLVASTLLMLLVLALRTPVRRAFGPQLAYALWALPALRMALPPFPESWRGQVLPVLPVPQDITLYLGEPVATLAAEPVHGIGWPTIAIALWIAGSLAFIGYHVVAHRRFCARVRAHASGGRIVAGGRVEVIETDATTGPLAFGVLRKYVAFPRDFSERYDPLEQDLALAHELGHHVRGDLIANWIALVVLAAHWFNPVAWRAFRAFRADQEMACDALVLSGRAAQLRHAYARAIVKSAHGGAVSAACHLHTVNEIKGRLKMLTRHERTSRPRLVAGGSGVVALVLAGLGLTASGTQAAESVRTHVEDAVGVDLASIELPALPQTPEPPTPPDAHEGPKARATAGTHRTRVVMRDRDGKISVYDTDEDGSRSGRRAYVIRTKDGKIVTSDALGATPVPPMPAMPPMPPMPPEALATLKSMPQISSRACRDGEGKGGENVIRRDEAGKRIVIICTNRLERSASAAVRGADAASLWATVSERHARTSALAGLRNARRSIEGNAGLSDEQRAAALSGIDQAIREMEHRPD